MIELARETDPDKIRNILFDNMSEIKFLVTGQRYSSIGLALSDLYKKGHLTEVPHEFMTHVYVCIGSLKINAGIKYHHTAEFYNCIKEDIEEQRLREIEEQKALSRWKALKQKKLDDLTPDIKDAMKKHSDEWTGPVDAENENTRN